LTATGGLNWISQAIGRETCWW